MSQQWPDKSRWEQEEGWFEWARRVVRINQPEHEFKGFRWRDLLRDTPTRKAVVNALSQESVLTTSLIISTIGTALQQKMTLTIFSGIGLAFLLPKKTPLQDPNMPEWDNTKLSTQECVPFSHFQRVFSQETIETPCCYLPA